MGPWVVIFVVVALLFFLKRRWDNSPTGKSSNIVKDWPGPPKQPIVGNSLQFKVGAPLAAQFLDGWYPRYGSPMRVSFGPIHGVHVFSPQHVEAIFKSQTNLRKSREYRFVEEWLGNGLLISYGEKWFQRRKLLTPTFHFAILKDFMPVFNAQTAQLARILRARVAAAPGVPFDICPAITNAALDIICETAMGATKNTQEDADSPYAEAIKEFADLGNYRTMRPWLWPDFVWNHLSPYGPRWRKYLGILHDFTNTVITERIRERKESSSQGAAVEAQSEDAFGQQKKRRVFLDLLLEMMDEGTLSRGDVTEEVDTFMFEGHDTTAHGVMWAIYSFARNPECQRRAREEINDVMGDRTELRTEDLPELKYFDMCVKESQRMWPSVPMIIRELDFPLKLDEKYTVPAKTGLFINIMQLHRDPNSFPEPERFDPERFSAEASAGRHPFAFVPFSAGQRNCIGQRFAQMEMKIALVTLLRNFEFRSDVAEGKMEPAFMFILRPEKGVVVTLKPLDLGK